MQTDVCAVHAHNRLVCMYGTYVIRTGCWTHVRHICHQKWLLDSLLDLGHHDYGRQLDVFSLTPGNQAHATTTLVIWYKQTQSMDTSSKLTNRLRHTIYY